MQKREKYSVTRNRAPGARQQQSAVKSIARASNVLICLSNGTNTVTGIAESCRLSKSTVHRLLKALEESNLAIRDTINHRYYVGHLITRLASNPRTTHEYLISSAIEEINNLSDYAEETVTLGILLGPQYILLHETPSKHSLRVADGTQRVAPPFAGAPVKVLLSQLNESDLKITLKILETGRVPEKSGTNEELFSQLRQIREQGYALSAGERFAGVLGLSVPVRNYVCPASLSVIGPEARLNNRAPELVSRMKSAADRISRRIADIFGKQ